MGDTFLLVLGLFIAGVGFVNFMGNISTIHSYNRRHVREEDVPRYGRAIGAGTMVIGAGLTACFFAQKLWGESAAPFIILPAAAVGLGLILYAQFKYNGGLF